MSLLVAAWSIPFAGFPFRPPISNATVVDFFARPSRFTHQSELCPFPFAILSMFRLESTHPVSFFKSIKRPLKKFYPKEQRDETTQHYPGEDTKWYIQIRYCPSISRPFVLEESLGGSSNSSSASKLCRSFNNERTWRLVPSPSRSLGWR